MSTPTVIRHVHLTSSKRKVLPFVFGQAVQSQLVHQFLSHKALSSPSLIPLHSPVSPPKPTILTWTSRPIYTFGRRERTLETLTPEQIALLRTPISKPEEFSRRDYIPSEAEIVETLRGGQTTFHGPGQILIYPILDLKTSFPNYPKGLNVRQYVYVLEEATIRTLLRWKILGVRTDNPGVWDIDGERKIAALGVRLRRHISSFGVGLNVSTDLEWFDRIVACGLEGKKVTSMLRLGLERNLWPEKASMDDAKFKALDSVVQGKVMRELAAINKSKKISRHILTPEAVGEVWVKEFKALLYGESAEDRVEKLLFTDPRLGLPNDLIRGLRTKPAKWPLEAEYFKEHYNEEDVYR